MKKPMPFSHVRAAKALKLKCSGAVREDGYPRTAAAQLSNDAEQLADRLPTYLGTVAKAEGPKEQEADVSRC